MHINAILSLKNKDLSPKFTEGRISHKAPKDAERKDRKGLFICVLLAYNSMKRIIIAFALLLFASALAHGQVGYLDKTFGDGGVVTVELGNHESIYPLNIRILPNGDMMHCGVMDSTPNTARTYIVKHHSDGKIDSSFGHNGYCSFLSGRGYRDWYFYYYPDGKFLIYGDDVDSVTYKRRPSILRFLPNGVLDNSFGTAGRYITASSIQEGTFFELKVRPDGSIIALGSWNNIYNPDWLNIPTITRITSNGRNDKSFGDAGTMTVRTDVDLGYINDAIFSKNDRCIFSYTQTPLSSSGSYMLSTDLNGVLDSSFGTNGILGTQLSDDWEYIAYIVEDTGDKLICIANLKSGSYQHSVLIRFSSDGSIDNSFGVNGIVVPPNYSYYSLLDYITFDSARNIFATGHFYDSASISHPIILCYNNNGIPDSSHGTDKTMIEVSKHMKWISSAAVQSDGKYIIMGWDGYSRYITNICRVNNNGIVHVVPAYTDSSPLSLHPTPSTDNCTVTYTLPASGECTMTLRDESGREVRTFETNEHRTAGDHKEELDLRGLAAGVYFLQIESGGSIQTGKLIKQ